MYNNVPDYGLFTKRKLVRVIWKQFICVSQITSKSWLRWNQYRYVYKLRSLIRHGELLLGLTGR